MGRKDVILESFKFDTEPSFTPRTPYYTMCEEELESIRKFPFISDYKVSFTIVASVRDIKLELTGVIPKGFCYNLADIPWIAEPLSYDKHSPFVKNASYIHDYLISRKKVLYLDWELKEKGVTPKDFRILTSLIFAYVLKLNAVPHYKAHLMATFVDMWQSILPSWRALDKTEMTL